MNIKQVVKLEFDLSDQKDVQKFNQFQKIDEIVKANIEFKKFLDSLIEADPKELVTEGNSIYVKIKNSYIGIYKNYGVEV
jgi:hypothetical protein